jgi:hypothetical protein
MVERTTNFAFELIEFDKIPWHENERDNWRSLDAVLSRFISILNFKGTWQNATAVVQGDRYVDPDLFTIWECDVSHTTPSTGTFAADRATNTGRWTSFTTEFASGGAYTLGTEYAVNTFIVDSNRYGVASGTFTATVSYNSDVAAGNILTLIDLSTDLAAASSSADDAATSAVAAAASAASLNLPTIVASTYLKALAGATGYETLTATGVKTDIAAASSGANDDITSITGVTSLNSVTTISGMTTPLSIAQGGTAATTAATAIAGLGGTTATSTDTLTNKTFDANGSGNSLSNVDIADLTTLATNIGNIISFSATGEPTLISGGSDGQVLTSVGATGAPAFETLSVNTGLTLISTITASNDATLDFDDIFSSTYDNYLVVGQDVLFQTDQQFLSIRTATGGSTYDANASDYGWAVRHNQSTNVVDYDAADGAMDMNGDGADVNRFGNHTTESICFTVHVFNPLGTVGYKNFKWEISYPTYNSGTIMNLDGAGQRIDIAAIASMQFVPSSGNIVSGIIRVYGITDS